MSDRSLWLRVSAEGKQGGFVSLPDASGGALAVTVLPKVWSPTRGGRRRVKHNAGSATHVVAYELETLEVLGAPAALADLTLSLVDISRPGERQLLTPTAPLPSGRAANTPGGGSSSETYDALLRLLLLAEMSGVRFNNDATGQESASDLTRFLVQRQFVEAIVPLLFRAQSLYREHTQELRIPRGRLDDASVALMRATGIPLMRSTYDELTIDTPLLQVIAAALNLVVNDRTHPGLAILDDRFRTVAAALRSHFGGVRVLGPDVALRMLSAVRFRPQDERWRPVLGLARRVLIERSVVPIGGDQATTSLIAYFPSEKLWEQLCGDTLTAVFEDVRVSRDNKPASGVRVPEPWARTRIPQGLSNDQRFPDFLFRHDAEVIVADAKYKVGGSLSSADGYQLYTYSNLATLDGAPVTAAMVIYPSVGPERPPLRLWRQPGGDLSLWLMKLPFPRSNDLSSPTAWAAYRREGTRRVRTAMTQSLTF